ncbi:MAG: tRNA lysidine(34) synthetase TilS [Myxococcaceae bacterium]
MKTKTRRLLQPIWNAFDVLFPPEGLLLCVSGGSDSRALMEAVAHWPHRVQNIHIVSVDHATRPETKREAEAVCARAKILGFESHLLSLYPVIKKDEASLRAGRYGLIWQLARDLGIRAIATAHTQDDQAESFIMDMMGHGGGTEGSAMPAVSERPEGLLLRPLLEFTRAYLIAVLSELGQEDYFTDPTNQQSLGSRVQVRDFLKLHPTPQTRLAGLAQKRKSDLDALKAWACDLIEVYSAGQVLVKFTPEIPEAVLLQAFKKALSSLLPDQDLRSAHKTLELMAKQKKGSFDLPGCVAEIRDSAVLLRTARSII